MKTLVIHPSDRSTDFLKQIYEGRDFTVVNAHRGDEGYSKKQFIDQVKSHDRIIMMGHGFPGGLFYSYVDSTVAYLLREKECICIWCHADKFVEKYNLKGFSTMMFCSEYSECEFEGVENVKKGMVEESNNTFSLIMSKYVEQSLDVIHKKVIYEYGELAERNSVAEYNNKRLLLFQ
jgi:hypothetical protein